MYSLVAGPTYKWAAIDLNKDLARRDPRPFWYKTRRAAAGYGNVRYQSYAIARFAK